ncbi:MAG: helix-turn-helix domain-containing protein [Desulfovibrionaceae bacterium]|nr:helix-turn-helix domain-containing protein [Desulfovibrionaceae bacterium]
MDISPEIAAQAVALIQAGHSQRNVSAQLNLSRSAVRNVYRRYLETGGFVRRQGRP